MWSISGKFLKNSICQGLDSLSWTSDMIAEWISTTTVMVTGPSREKMLQDRNSANENLLSIKFLAFKPEQFWNPRNEKDNFLVDLSCAIRELSNYTLMDEIKLVISEQNCLKIGEDLW